MKKVLVLLGMAAFAALGLGAEGAEGLGAEPANNSFEFSGLKGEALEEGELSS